MIDIIIIADDFTGALDTGVQFALAGIKTVVRTGDGGDFNELAEEGVQILVLDTETRHLPPGEAYRAVFHITKKAVESGIKHIYKKTDSALRGNIGSELSAVLNASDSTELPFIPALPHMNRITREGIHYIDGKPVKESVFGVDPFEPVLCSYIPDIIKLQSEIPTLVIKKGEGPPESREKAIHVYDVESKIRLQEIADSLFRKNKLPIMAGCAGFASVLPELFHLKSIPQNVEFPDEGILVINGSLNPITAGQLDYAEACCGFHRVILKPWQKVEKDYWKRPEGVLEQRAILQSCREHRYFVIDGRDKNGSNITNEYAAEKGMDADCARKQIAGSLGKLVRSLVENDLHHTLMVIGGDTLQSIQKELGVYEMRPVCEIFPGTVLSKFCFRGREYQLISKSGGFGEKSLLEDISDFIRKDRKEKKYV